MITVLAVPFDDERAHALREAQRAEIGTMYGEPDLGPELSSEGVIASPLALD